MDGTMYCGDLGRSPFQLVADYIAGGGRLLQPNPAAGKFIFTQNGRSAIALAARLWDVRPGDEILMPSYNCGSEISPFAAANATISMYRVDGRARIDVADIVARLTPRTKVVCVVHYFGQAADIDELAAICRSRNIRLLEDCALSLFSKNIGSIGDAAIFSLPKTLPSCGGGLLSLRDSKALADGLLQPSDGKEAVRAVLSLLKKWLKSSPIGVALRKPPQRIEDSAEPDVIGMPDKYYWLPGAEPRRAPRTAVGAFLRADAGEIVRQRRSNCSQLRQSLAGVIGVRFLWAEEGLPDGMCPLGLPVLVENRRWWWEELNAHGVVVTPWWEGYHRGLDWSEFPEARALKAQLLLLPVHQGLGADHIKYLAEVVRALAARQAA